MRKGLRVIKLEVRGLAVAFSTARRRAGRNSSCSPAARRRHEPRKGNCLRPPRVPWVEGLIEETAAFPRGRHDDQVDALTQALNRLRQSGAMFGVPESQIVVSHFPIPADWPRAFGMAVEPQGVAALWGAEDPSGTTHLYAEHQLPHGEPSANARAILKLGSWIPGVLSAGSLKGSKNDRNGIAQIYREAGLKIYTAHQGEDADMYQVWQMFAQNKIKVFDSLVGFLAAYRTGAAEALLLLCCQALIRSRRFMQTQPVPQAAERWPADFSRGPRD